MTIGVLPAPARERPAWPRPAGWAVAAVVVVVLLATPLGVTPYTNLQLTLIVAYAVAIRGLDVLTGYTGQVSLGQSAFFGIGAYAAAYGFGHGWPAVGGFLAAAALSGAVGFLAAIPAVRLRGFAFGIITLALPVVAVPLAIRLQGVTGGSQGLSVPTLAAPAWSGLADDQWHFYVVLVAGAAVFLLVRTFLAGRIGRALGVVRTNEIVATSLGVPVQRYKVLAFAVAAMCGGTAGWLYMVPVQFISPDGLQLTLAISMLVSLVVGGVRSPLGSVIGAAFYVLVPDVTDKVTPGRSYLYFGAALLVVLFFFPSGVAGAAKTVVGAVATRLARNGYPQRGAGP